MRERMLGTDPRVRVGIKKLIKEIERAIRHREPRRMKGPCTLRGVI